jgi:putative transcriptional regulator
MQNLKSCFLQATSLLKGSVFEKALILIIEDNEKGSTGFIVNQPFHRRFNELVEFRHSPSLQMYYGGPVEEEGLFFLHQRPDVIPNAIEITTGLYYAGSFAEAVKYINNKTINENQIKLLVGYCGWDAGQLNEEIAEGSWEIADNATFLF